MLDKLLEKLDKDELIGSPTKKFVDIGFFGRSPKGTSSIRIEAASEIQQPA